MRYRLYIPKFFIVIILFAAFYFQLANPTAGAASALLPLTGEAAVAHLKEQGLYSSLIQAVRAPRRAGPSVQSHFSEDDMVEGRAAASLLEPSAAFNLSVVQLFRQTATDGEANDSYGWSVAAADDNIVWGTAFFPMTTSCGARSSRKTPTSTDVY